MSEYRVLVAFDKFSLGGTISGASLTPETLRAAISREWLEPIPERKARRAPRNKARAAPSNKAR